MDNMFRGTTKECLQHYAEHVLPPKGSKGADRAKMPMAQFLGVKTHAITAWMSWRNKPLGESLVKLRFFLEAAGYEVTELTSLRDATPVLYKLAQMIAYDALKVAEAREMLGFSDQQSIYRLVHGGSSTTSEREHKIAVLYDEKRDGIEERCQELERQLGRREAAAAFPETHPAKPARPKTAMSNESISALANFILVVLPLIEAAVTDTAREQRVMLRKLTGDNGMFRLSNASSRLCSEKARELV